MRARRPAHPVPAIDVRAEALPLDDYPVDDPVAIIANTGATDAERTRRLLCSHAR
jgi:hypothetical protein